VLTPLRSPRPAAPGWVSDLVQDVVAARLRDAVDRLPYSVREVVGYHLGWIEEPGEAAGSTGKLIRPTLTLLSAAAVGGPVQRAADAAVAIELVHNYALLHDDVMDGALLRRHRETVWWRYGMPKAILAGNALVSLGMELLAGRPAAVSILCAAIREMVDGQGLDIAHEEHSAVTVGECLTAAGGKTAALLRCACELGALYGEGLTAQVRALSRFGWHLGMAYQLTDDLLGIWGNPRATGRAPLSDLRAGKKTLPVVAALRAGGPDSVELAELYQRPEPLDDEDLLRVAVLIERSGGRRWARAEAERQCRSALTCLRAADPTEDAYAALTALATGLVERDG